MTATLNLDEETAHRMAGLFRHRRALILEDEIGAEMQSALRQAGFEQVELAETGEAALAALESVRFDIVVLDRVNPGIEGLEVLDRIRDSASGLATGADTPVLVHSLLGGEADRIHGLVARGADDYIPKPASSEELVARVAAQLRRSGQNAGSTVEPSGWSCAPLDIDPEARIVSLAGRKIALTTRETDILIELYRERGNPLSQSMLWDRCWMDKGWSHFPDEFANTVDQAIKRLRRALAKQCPEIPESYHPLVVNIWSQGFALRNLANLGDTSAAA